jgi:putative acetyltransferase
MAELRIRPADPASDAVRPIVEAHLAFSRAETPETSCHVMQPEELAEPGVSFWALYRDGQAVGTGALKWLEGGLAEVKSVHVMAEARGQGLAERLIQHLEAQARAAGVTRLVLETGSESLPGYAAARRLYERLGYAYCGPIPGYAADPNSAFMTRTL